MKKIAGINLKLLLATSLAGMLVLSCTESRKATLPDSDAPDVLAIDLFGTPQGPESEKRIKLEIDPVALSASDKVKAENENGKIAVSSVTAPDQIKFMFKQLQVSGKAGKIYPVTFSVDRKAVTAYKVVSDLSELSALEKEYAVLKDEVALESALQRTSDSGARKKLIADIQKFTKVRAKIKTDGKVVDASTSLLVPIFQYKVASYGVLERTKNDLGEKTSTLQLKKTDWEQATHIKIEARGDEIGKVDVDPADREALDRTFSADNIDDQIMTAENLKTQFQVATAIAGSALVHTVLDSDGLNVFEITNHASLTQSQKDLIKTGAANGRIWECDKETLAKLPKDKPELQTDCVVIYRYVVPVKYVRLALPEIDNFGNKSSTIKIIDTPFDLNVGLVSIPEKIEPKRIEIDGIYDSTSILKVADIKDKEFFYRRTLEDAPETTTFMPGEASALTLVKFELNDINLIVRKSDNLVDFKTGSNETDVEEVMTIPVVYLRKETVDDRGVALATPRFVKTNKERAEYIFLNWTANRLSSADSPLSSYGRGQCFTGIADMSVRDVDMRMDQGVLSFTYQYSANLAPSEACVGLYIPALDYNPGGSYAQFSARLKERVSFKVNDKSSDEIFVPQTPFPVQNALGYGVWTLGKFKPTDNGVRGRNGQQVNLPVVQDFRAGRKLLYTVTGLPKDDEKKKELYKKTVGEIVEAWNQAYHLAFKGTALERGENYVELQFAGENGIEAHLGDIDKNIIHFENKFNDNHGVLGVSQVGINARSGVVVADSLIIYAGNLSHYVETTKRNNLIAKQYRELIAGMKKQALIQLAEKEKSEKSSENETQPIVAPGTEVGGGKVLEFSRRAQKMFAMSAPKDLKKSNLQIRQAALKAMKMMTPEIRKMAEERKRFGSGEKFALSSGKVENSFLQKSVEQAIHDPNLDLTEVEGIIAKEMLNEKSDSLRSSDRAALQRKVNLGLIRTQMKSQFNYKPGCMYAPRESLSDRLAGQSFEESLKHALYFTLGHEMGHSQGLTHNFIGSFDKANYTFADEKSDRNYSSIMDYIEPSFINWSGLGPYDVHAIRASHTGLLEAHPSLVDAIQKRAKDFEEKSVSAKKIAEASKLSGDENAVMKNLALAQAFDAEAIGTRQILVDNKFLHIDAIKKMLAPNGWSDFNKRSAKFVVKDFLYCTDKDVAYEPTCQRFDFGSTATEIVKNYVQDYEESYINNYHSWDRSEFGFAQKMSVISRTMNDMVNIRQFMDELFYKLVAEGPQSTGDEEKDKLLAEEYNATTQDYFGAVVESYLFFNQLIRVPDAQSAFLTQDRFLAVPYKYKETIKDENGQDKEVIKSDIQIVEKRAVGDLATTPDRYDTIGIEYDKIMAMNFLAMKGLPYFKYVSQSLQLSYLDFEKYILRMDNPLNGATVNAMVSMFLDKLQPTFSNEKVNLVALDSLKAQVTNSMRAYAGIFSILGLETSTLRDKDNFANLFKVGSSLGKAPNDRIALAPLGVASGSRAKTLYWSLDNASASDELIKSAAKKNFFITNEERILKPLVAVAKAQLDLALDDAKDTEKTAGLKAEVEKAKLNCVTALKEINKRGDIASGDEIAATPQFAIEKQVDLVTKLNSLIIQLAPLSTPIGSQLGDLPDLLPLLDYAQKAMVAAAALHSEVEGLEPAIKAVVDGSVTETRYGLIVKNLQFLNQLTFMTNPELNRQ